MNFSFSKQQVREVLVSLGVKSPNLIEMADDWLKPILIDSIEYQNLKDKEIFILGRYNEKKSCAGVLFTIVIVIGIFYFYFKIRKQDVNLMDMLIGVLGIGLGLLFIVSLTISFLQYKITVRQSEKFVKKWVEKVRAVPGNVERLMGFDQMIQACETVLRQKNGGWVGSNRELLVEYILIVKGDPAPLLSNFFSAVKISGLNENIKGYLTQNPLIYALIYLYSPGNLLAFLEACYDSYLKDSFSFDTDRIEKLFDQYILKI
jgi:hypothetical protein